MRTIILIVSIFLLGCTTRENHSRIRNFQTDSKVDIQPRFNIGDIVYLKPDSTKAVIEKVMKCGCMGNKRSYDYQLYYFTKMGEKKTENDFDDALIY